MQRSFRLTALGLAAVMVSGAALVATGQQEERQERRQRAEQQAAEGERAGQRQEGHVGHAHACMLSEQDIAACFILDNQGQVALAEFAMEHSQNEDVKQFAQQMVQEHTECISKLQQFAGPVGASLTTRPQVRGQSEEGNDNPRQRRETEDQNEQEGDRPRAEREEDQPERPAAENQAEGRRQSRQAAAAGHGEGIDLIAYKQEIGQKCLESTKKMLVEQQGADFDKAYLAQQCMAHMHMADVLEVTAQHVSPEFKELVMAGHKTTMEHLEHCQTLCKQLEGASGSINTAERDANRPE